MRRRLSIAALVTPRGAARTGIFATLASLLGAKGSGAPARARLASLLAAALLLGLAAIPAQAAAFGVEEFDVSFVGPQGEALTQAGSHPFAMNTRLAFNSHLTAEGREIEAAAKDFWTTQMPGFVGNPTAVPTCPTSGFLTKQNGFSGQIPNCPDAAAVGTVAVGLAGPTTDASTYATVYNLKPPPGIAAKLGFIALNAPVTIELGAAESPPYSIVGGPTNISQVVEVASATLTLWGVPADSAHDPLRGRCLDLNTGGSAGNCSAGVSPKPFLTLPRACSGPLKTTYAADSWEEPGARLASGRPDLSDPAWLQGFTETHDESGPAGMTGCGKLGFAPEATAVPTSKAATSPSGLDFTLKTKNEGLENPAGFSNADIEKAVVTLPVGFTTNPSLAEGLEVCTEAQFEAETPYAASGEEPDFAPPGVGCPEAAKIGSVEAETPILEGKLLKGSLFIAKPYENPFGSLIAIYMVIKEPGLGVVIKVPLQVEADPVTGQLKTTAENLPPYPVSRFALHFREGTRSPLATPPACGAYDGHDASHEPVRAVLYPTSGAAPAKVSSAFEIISGPDGGPCPAGGLLPPFHPALTAGTLNNAAGRFSPFNVKLTRTDSEQEFTHFSIKLPPGLSGKLAGVAKCPDAAIAAAKSRERQPDGGQEEIERPSCPAGSEVGRTLVGAGVGPSLAYAPGKLYLAGPYKGSQISIVSITAAKVGPFDLGTVVYREGLKVNPETAQVSVDAAGSDPIPHIVEGIPVHLRDIRIYVNRPNFTINPTSCEKFSTASTVLGSGLDFASEADDQPVTVTSPFQAADCASLGFKPKLQLKLKGKTRRGGLPKLTATVTYPKQGAYANIAKTVVTLPPSEFLEQGHIGSSCTRVQFNAGGGNGEQCPAKSILGKAKAITPLLDEPVEGLVYLRSNGGERKLPDLVAALHSEDININLVGFIDSFHKKGSEVSQIRNTFAAVPDAPVSKFTLELFGGKKGLLVNSTNICKGTHKAISEFTGQNGKRYDTKPAVQAQCGKKGKKHTKKHKSHGRKQVSARVGSSHR